MLPDSFPKFLQIYWYLYLSSITHQKKKKRWNHVLHISLQLAYCTYIKDLFPGRACRSHSFLATTAVTISWTLTVVIRQSLPVKEDSQNPIDSACKSTVYCRKSIKNIEVRQRGIQRPGINSSCPSSVGAVPDTFSFGSQVCHKTPQT